MNQIRAVARVQFVFPGAIETVNTAPAGAGVVVDSLGRLWPDRCRCPQHPNKGHEARPVERPRRSA